MVTALWRIICGVAVANVLALLLFVAYLVGTGRLDAQRLTEVRAVLEPTPAEAAAMALEAEKAAAGEAEVEPVSGPPLDASERLELRLQRTELDRQRAQRLQREVEDLQRTLAVERRRLDEERRTLDRDLAAFKRERDEIAQTEGRDQFRRALETLQGLRPPDAKVALEAIIAGQVDVYDVDEGLRTDPDAGLDQAVAYLNAMDDRQRTKIVAEFIKDNEVLAADLLERLRTRGVVARVSGDEP